MSRQRQASISTPIQAASWTECLRLAAADDRARAPDHDPVTAALGGGPYPGCLASGRSGNSLPFTRSHEPAGMGSNGRQGTTRSIARSDQPAVQHPQAQARHLLLQSQRRLRHFQHRRRAGGDLAEYAGAGAHGRRDGVRGAGAGRPLEGLRRRHQLQRTRGSSRFRGRRRSVPRPDIPASSPRRMCRRSIRSWPPSRPPPSTT